MSRNYDEAKVKPYTLPDPLKLANGQPVPRAAETWFLQRPPGNPQAFPTGDLRPHSGPILPGVKWEVASTDPSAMDGSAIMKKVVGQMSDHDNCRMNRYHRRIPAKATKPVPMILTITFGGGAKAGKPGKAFVPKVGAGKGGDPVADILARGWGYATIGYGDIQPDRDNAWTEGVIGLSATSMQGQASRQLRTNGADQHWTWGISRIVDYFETDKGRGRQTHWHPRTFPPGPYGPLGRLAGMSASPPSSCSCSGCAAPRPVARD